MVWPFGLSSSTKTLMSKSPHRSPGYLRSSKALQEQAWFGEAKTEGKHRQSAFDAKYHLFNVLSFQCNV